MPINQREPPRRSFRLQGYDYSQPGHYFVTLCTQDRKWMLGEIVNGEMRLNQVGSIVQSIWNTLPERFPHIELDQYVVMPNHMHGIIALLETSIGTAHQGFPADTASYSGTTNPALTLGEIIRTFKGR